MVFMASSSSSPSSSSSASAEDGGRRRRAVAEVVVATAPANGARAGDATSADDDEDEEEDSVLERRMRLKAKIREQEEEDEEEELAKMEDEEEEESEEEGSSEYETDTSDSEDEGGYGSRRPVVAPTFVRKQDRDTIRERERKEQEEALQAQKEEEQKERRKAQTRDLLVEAIQKERADAQQNEGGDNDGSSSESEADPEEEDEEAEFEKWKIRELKRIRRDQEEKLQWEKELQEIERRRGLSDAEIAKLDAEALQPKEKKKWKFLQKYYHKGAFYQDDELVKETDYSEPTLEDKFDRTILPKVMQVKNFGRAGRTKYTHLVDQDTTYLGGGKTNPFARPGENPAGGAPAAPADRWDPWSVAPALRAKYTQKMGGVGSVDDPLHRKRKRPGADGHQ